MNIGNTRFWFDRDPRSIGIRSANHKTSQQPFEVYLKKHPAILNFYVYETEAGDGGPGVEFRLSFSLLWFSLNCLLWTDEQREVNEWDGDAPNRPRSWGWRFDTESYYPSLNMKWGHRHPSWNLPFFTQMLEETQVLTFDLRPAYREPAKAKSNFDARRTIAAENSKTFDYTYTRTNGEKQQVKATVNISTQIRRRKWTPIVRVYTYIDVQFSEGIGERVDSWKGGCTACSFELRKGETMEDSLRRMEATRKF